VEPEFLDEGKSTQRYLGKRFSLMVRRGNKMGLKMKI
jgi:hypothetical protein